MFEVFSCELGVFIGPFALASSLEEECHRHHSQADATACRSRQKDIPLEFDLRVSSEAIKDFLLSYCQRARKASHGPVVSKEIQAEPKVK